MKKLDTKSLQADWSAYARRPTWAHITSAELAKVFGVHLQTICNWRIRGILPEPEARSRKLRGNKRYYRISAIRSWLEGKSEDQVHLEWLNSEGVTCKTPGQAKTLSQILKPGFFTRKFYESRT